MAAFMIVTAYVHDRERFVAGYGPAAAALIGKFGGRYVVRAPGAVVLEGPAKAGASIVISEWPDKAAALAFWSSPEYAEVRKLRDGLADVSVMLVEVPQAKA